MWAHDPVADAKCVLARGRQLPRLACWPGPIAGGGVDKQRTVVPNEELRGLYGRRHTVDDEMVGVTLTDKPLTQLHHLARHSGCVAVDCGSGAGQGSVSGQGVT